MNKEKAKTTLESNVQKPFKLLSELGEITVNAFLAEKETPMKGDPHDHNENKNNELEQPRHPLRGA